MELEHPKQGLSHSSSTGSYRPMYIASHKTHSENQNSLPQYLISYITALLTLTQQTQQYRGYSFPESADHIPLSASHEGNVWVTKAGCEKKQKNTVVSSLSPSSAAREQGQG